MKKLLVVIAVLVPILIMAESAASRSVHKFAFTNQVGSLADTVVFTSTTDADILTSIYLENLTAPPAANAVCATIKWTDDIGNQSSRDFCAQAPFNYQEQTRLLHIKGGTSVTVSGFSPNTPPDQNFSLFLVVRSE